MKRIYYLDNKNYSWCIIFALLTTAVFADSHTLLFESDIKKHSTSLIALTFNSETWEVEEVRKVTDSRVNIGAYCAHENQLFVKLRLKTPPSDFTSPYLAFLSNVYDLSQKEELQSISRLYSPSPKIHFDDPQISHDGKKLVFTLDKMIDHKDEKMSPIPSKAIYTYNFNTAAIKEIVPYGYLCEEPVFSPDDELIAFYRAYIDIVYQPGEGRKNDTIGHRLCVVPSNGGEVRVLSPSPNSLFSGIGQSPSWSPDGEKILFIAQYNEPEKKYPDLFPTGIYMVDLKDEKIERLTPFDERASMPSWSPDGRKFAYIQKNQLCVMDIGKRESYVLIDSIGGKCVWSPNADLIAYKNKEGILSVISSDGEKRLELTRDIHPTAEYFWVK